jgi:hypothetical protein
MEPDASSSPLVPILSQMHPTNTLQPYFPKVYSGIIFPTTLSSSEWYNSVATVFSEPAVWRLLTFRVPNLISIFSWLGSSKGSVQFRGSV